MCQTSTVIGGEQNVITRKNEHQCKTCIKELEDRSCKRLPYTVTNYEQADKGNLTARQNGYVGGYMTKKLVEMAEKQLAGK